MAIFLVFLIGVGAIALMIPATVLRGWALSILWGWFAVPILGAPPLGIAQSIGIALVVGMLAHQYVPSKEKDVAGPLVAMSLGPFIALFIGWIVKGFM